MHVVTLNSYERKIEWEEKRERERIKTKRVDREKQKKSARGIK